MGKKYELVVFDWEGTLSDTLGLILHCVAEEARLLHFGELDEALARQCVELGLVNAVKKVFPSLTMYEHNVLLDRVQQSLSTKHSEVYLLPGASDIVKNLFSKGVKLAIASNKGSSALQRALAFTGLDVYFQEIRTASQFSPKPCPDMLEDILLASHLTKDKALMIGDSTIDMEMANSIGMDAIGVNFYQKDPDTLLKAGAMAVFESYSSLADYLYP